MALPELPTDDLPPPTCGVTAEEFRKFTLFCDMSDNHYDDFRRAPVETVDANEWRIADQFGDVFVNVSHLSHASILHGVKPHQFKRFGAPAPDNHDLFGRNYGKEFT